MKKTFLGLTLLLSLASCLLFSACGSPDPEPLPNSCTSECPKNFECIDGFCECPSNFTYNGNCIKFGNPNHVWIGTPGCSCIDTLLLEFIPPTKNEGSAQVFVHAKVDSLVYRRYDGWATYIVRPEGDSVRMFYLPVERCPTANGNFLEPVFSGSMSKDGKSFVGKVDMFIVNTNQIVTSCDMTLRKKE